METNYELKHKCLLVPLRAVLLVLVMLLVGFTTYAQTGKSVRVANNEQLIEALQNPSVGTVVLGAGNYPYLDYQAEEGAKVIIKDNENGNRDDCTFFIINNNVCFDAVPGTYVSNFAQAGTLPNLTCPLDNTGLWTVEGTPPGNVNFLSDPWEYDMFFEVDQPGFYSLRYTWDDFNTFVETEYYFYGPVVVELSAPDVCATDGLYTTVTFTRTSAQEDPGTTVEWTLNGAPYDGPETTGQFQLNVPWCGEFTLCVTVDPVLCPPVTECITVDFSCQPTADAGPDINVCDELCVYLEGSTGLSTFSPSYAYSWYQTGGPGTLTFNPNAEELFVQACIDENPPCEYGEYTVELQVQNGECYDEDDAIIRFYQQPIAEAGVVAPICDDFTFNLGATPFVYCGTEGTNYWSTAYWELVSFPAGAVVAITDINDPNTEVSITGGVDVCLYGDYTFRWVEENSKGVDLGGCEASDLVTVTIVEDPAPDAGEELVLCNTFEFDLFGYGDEPCNPETEVTYSWEKTAEPGNCNVVITSGNTLYPHISISGCDDLCEYGKYTFELTQSNDGVCEGTDAVDVWILEQAAADAGSDQHLCYSFGFNLTADPTDFCGVAGTNYFTWGTWTLVSGPTTDVTIVNPAGPATGVTINDVSGCAPYGKYTFRWTEYNGFVTGIDFEGCSDFDEVDIYIYEQPEVLAGTDQEYCDVSTFYLDGTIDELCTDWAVQIKWELVSQPGLCDVSFMYDYMIDPMVTISNCGASCAYGEYIFKVTQKNGYYTDQDAWVTVCEDSDLVSVWNYEPPTDVDAGLDQELCDDFTFTLTAAGSDYCSTPSNWYSWGLVSQPADAGCNVSFTNQFGLSTEVVIDGCTGDCAYGEFVFRFTEFNGSSDVYCYDWDEVSVYIFEMPDADAGADVNACVDIDLAPYCYDMTGTLEYCYSMNGLWTKTCGPGDVVFEDVNDPNSEACFEEPGRYKFTWTAWNDAEGCMDEEEVIFDLLEQPEASADITSITPECNTLCVDLGLAGVNKYVYFGTDVGECPNYLDFAKWTLVEGSGGVTFADDTDPETEMCVTIFGGYTVRWNEVNRAVDGLSECSDYVDIYVEFNETPEPIAVGGEICGNCFTLDGTLDGGFDPSFYWELLAGGNCPVSFDPFALDAEVCIEDTPDCYGDYVFVLHQFNGECEGTDTAYVTFYDLPNPVAICFDNYPNDCPEDYYGGGYDTEWNPYGCLQPNEVLEVCADGQSNFYLTPWCDCVPGFDWYNEDFYGWTFEWSLIAPAGTSHYSQPGYYDFEMGQWIYPYLDVTWGECCDTARIYLTITTDDDCELTLEYKAFVYHKPCVDIVGPDVAEVDMTTEYCNNCPPNPCLLYTWTAEHCGIITDGQGTECIDVLWTDYNVNGGWGEITLTVFDTCTGCCNYDAMPVKIWPAGTLGDATLSGYVYYHNESETPLNGVEIQLWNGTVPVMSTTSSNDVEGGGMGYYEFTGVNATTEFGVTASYDAPWYGANATDALAVELRAIEFDPMPILMDDVVEDAMNVNNSVIPFITAVDALWIKQRAVNMVNYFPAGNWAFDPAMSTQAVVGYDIYALTMGDANSSNIPASMKSMPAIDLVNDGIMNVVTGEVFTLPIRIAKANEFGAIQLDLEYNPSLVEVVEVVPVEGMISNITDGNVYIAFSNLNTMVLSDNDVVVTLKVKALGEIAIPESMFSIGINSEFADANARTIEPVILKSFGITTGPAALDYFLSANRPNPFSTSTFIEYTMPETGKVKLSVLDMLGQEIAVLVESTQTAGAYTVEFSAAGLATGVYLYKITVDGETRDFISTQRMVVSH